MVIYLEVQATEGMATSPVKAEQESKSNYSLFHLQPTLPTRSLTPCPPFPYQVSVLSEMPVELFVGICSKAVSVKIILGSEILYMFQVAQHIFIK